MLAAGTSAAVANVTVAHHAVRAAALAARATAQQQDSEQARMDENMHAALFRMLKTTAADPKDDVHKLVRVTATACMILPTAHSLCTYYICASNMHWFSCSLIMFTMRARCLPVGCMSCIVWQRSATSSQAVSATEMSYTLNAIVTDQLFHEHI